jgi:hypothetical protein
MKSALAAAGRGAHLRSRQVPRRRAILSVISLAGCLIAIMVLANDAVGAFTFTAVEGDGYSGEIGGVILSCPGTDPNFNCNALPATISNVSVNWGDGTINTAGQAVKSSNCMNGDPGCGYIVNGTHTYAEEGSNITVTYSVPNGASSRTGTSTATVRDAPLRGSGATGLSAQEGNASSFDLGTFSDFDPSGSVTDYTATIDWGDGTTSSGVVSGEGPFDVTGNHAYHEEGTPTVTVTITDGGGGETAFTAQLTIDDAGLSATPSTGLTEPEGSSPTLTLATLTDADPGAAASDYSATVDWGDGTSSIATVEGDPTVGVTIIASHGYAEEGDRTATVSVADAGGSKSTASVPIRVEDAPLSVHPVGVAAVAYSAFTGTVATFADADPGGTVADYQATIEWGDGSSSSGTIKREAGGDFVVAGAHRYARAGSYTATVAVNDRGGASSSASDNVAAVMPPSLVVVLTWRFQTTRGFSTVASLVLTGAPVGGRVIIICYGGGCPFTKHAIQIRPSSRCHHRPCSPARSGTRTVDLTRQVAGHHLRIGTRLIVEVLRSGFIGKYYRFSVRPKSGPLVQISCVVSDSSEPGDGCNP